MKRWLATVVVTLGLLSLGPAALAKGSQHKNLKPVNGSSKVHKKPRMGAKAPKQLGTERRTGNKSGNVETAEHDRNIEDAQPAPAEGGN